MRCRILTCLWLSCFATLFQCPVLGIKAGEREREGGKEREGEERGTVRERVTEREREWERGGGGEREGKRKERKVAATARERVIKYNWLLNYSTTVGCKYSVNVCVNTGTQLRANNSHNQYPFTSITLKQNIYSSIFQTEISWGHSGVAALTRHRRMNITLYKLEVYSLIPVFCLYISSVSVIFCSSWNDMEKISGLKITWKKKKEEKEQIKNAINFSSQFIPWS